MDKPNRKIRVVGERRADLDTKRFAEAIVAFAIQRIRDEGQPTDPPNGQPERGGEERSA
jgi:hypothetical protein